MGLILLEVAVSELVVGTFEGVGSIGDLGLSVFKFGVTFGFLSSVNFIVCDLFLVDGVFEAIKDSLDGVKGTT